jgi:hypothetical protein
MKKEILLIILLFSLIFLVGNVSAAITFTNGYWNTTFNCPEWEGLVPNYNYPLNCDGISRGGDNSDSLGRYEKITTESNYNLGGGGRGNRWFFGNQTTVAPWYTPKNDNSGDIVLDLPGHYPEFWIRMYMRWKNGTGVAGQNSLKMIYPGTDPGSPALYFDCPYYYDSNTQDACRIVINGAVAYYAQPHTGWQSWFNSNYSDESWHFFEIHLRLNDPGVSNGVVQFWVNGDLKFDKRDINYGYYGINLSSGGFIAIPLHVNHDYFTPEGWMDTDDIAVAIPSYTGFVKDNSGNNMIGPVATSGPQVTSISGNISNGNTITISGSGFGTKAAAPLISSYDNNISANNWANGTIGTGWLLASGQGSVALATSTPRSSLYQSDNYINASMTYNEGGFPYHTIGYHPPTATDKYYYCSFWKYVTANPFTLMGSGGNMKDWRYYPTNDYGIQTAWEAAQDTGGPYVHYGWAADVPPSTDYVDVHTLNPVQTWIHQEVLVYAGTLNGNDGSIKAIFNGKNGFDYTGISFLTTAHPNARNDILVGQVSGGSSVGGNIYIDQLYIDNTLAHVFISNKSDITNWLTYSSMAHNEIQVPKSWNTNSINITLNQGPFNNGDKAYLYVVNANGSISNPYNITISGQTQPPVAPNVTTMQKILNGFGDFKSNGISLSDYINSIKNWILGK